MRRDESRVTLLGAIPEFDRAQDAFAVIGKLVELGVLVEESSIEIRYETCYAADCAGPASRVAIRREPGSTLQDDRAARRVGRMPESISTILAPEFTRVGVDAPGKTELLQYVSELMSQQVSGASPGELLAGFLNREEMGSTGIGDGIAIPHCRLGRCTETRGVLIRTSAPVEFDSIDGRPVDLVFALLGPEADADGHLRVLAMLAERFNHPAFAQLLRDAADRQALYDAAVGFDPR